ncbi:keratinocyte differentiation factor 1 [Girardinichthys multiradiatus]|uniref:keratinocyte differentiation factor 1 n=1 Tax=Girardinichthys multiradiatus TaxID=208333 RepID=UPI001FAC83BA|nr:keratinocyte differentiation factor 1 [Girardinichthys multiradiatus]XP_047240219.1 keratinocyte differentiation factor 1 [Girardinichthys multiradiatus]
MSAGSSDSLRCSERPGNIRQVSFTEERCVDPVEDRQPTTQPKVGHKGRLKDANGNESETISFVPRAAEPSSTATNCHPCSSPKSCKTLVCTVITCGLYRLCQRSILAPCLAPNESSPDEPEKVSLRGVNPGDNKEETDTEWSDFHINGVKVVSPKEYLDVDIKSSAYAPPPAQTQAGFASLHESMTFDDWEDSEENVDSLITKKLLELYSEYQIEELARCTSDSVFLRKSKAITQLINCLAEEHKMDEQEAECRLVRGIIRISTRKSTRRRPPIPRMERTLSDSGHETMIGNGSFSSSNNNDYKSNPNIQISDLTSTDKFARNMWRKNGDHTSSSPTTYSPSHSEMESSGVPLLHTSVRT